MKEPIIVVDADKKSRRALGDLLERQNYRIITCHSLAALQSHVQEYVCRVAILDLDTVPVDNRSLRDLTRRYPDLRVIAVSERRFHPELSEAMASHIYACLCKPVYPA
jgi:DNA-binding NtrC family response regulator